MILGNMGFEPQGENLALTPIEATECYIIET